MNTNLKKRLDRIWERPDFYAFFEKFARPPRLIKKGTVLCNPGDPLLGVYFIKEGFIKLYEISENGKETIIYLTGPGNMLSLRAIVAKEHTAHQYAEAITNTTLYIMPIPEFFTILSTHPEYIADLLHMLIDRLDHAERRIEGFIAGDVTTRVANFIYDCALRFGKTYNNEVIIPVELTHQKISEFVGSFRETVSLSLNKLQKEKLIKISKARITVLDLENLRQRSLRNIKP